MNRHVRRAIIKVIHKLSDYVGLFDKASNTSTMIVLRRDRGKIEVLLGKRGMTADAYPGYWCLPGGFMNVMVKRKKLPGENALQTASRELLEETGLNVPPAAWQLTGQYSDPLTDPRDHVVNLAFMVCLDSDQLKTQKAGDDISDLEWMDVSKAYQRNLAFNHNRILVDGMSGKLNS